MEGNNNSTYSNNSSWLATSIMYDLSLIFSSPYFCFILNDLWVISTTTLWLILNVLLHIFKMFFLNFCIKSPFLLIIFNFWWYYLLLKTCSDKNTWKFKILWIIFLYWYKLSENVTCRHKQIRGLMCWSRAAWRRCW